MLNPGQKTKIHLRDCPIQLSLPDAKAYVLSHHVLLSSASSHQGPFIPSMKAYIFSTMTGEQKSPLTPRTTAHFPLRVLAVLFQGRGGA